MTVTIPEPTHILNTTNLAFAALLRAMRSERIELRVESFLPQSHGNFKQRNISEPPNFFEMAYGIKKIHFDFTFDTRDEPARHDHEAL